MRKYEKYILVFLVVGLSSCKLFNLYKINDKDLRIEKIEIIAVPFSIMFSGALTPWELEKMYTYRTVIDQFNDKGYGIKDVQNKLDSIKLNMTYDSLKFEGSTRIFDVRLRFKIFFNNKRFIIGYISDLGYLDINNINYMPNEAITKNIIYFLPEDYKPDW